jgi:hypothetical protein
MVLNCIASHPWFCLVYLARSYRLVLLSVDGTLFLHGSTKADWHAVDFWFCSFSMARYFWHAFPGLVLLALHGTLSCFGSTWVPWHAKF